LEDEMHEYFYVHCISYYRFMIHGYDYDLWVRFNVPGNTS